MKRRNRQPLALASGARVSDFTRGMVATGLLTAVQGRWTKGGPPAGRTILRHALQGGAALAAASSAADALRRRDYAALVLAVAAGAAGVVALEQLLNPAEPPPPHEDSHG